MDFRYTYFNIKDEKSTLISGATAPWLIQHCDIDFHKPLFKLGMAEHLINVNISMV
jgi:hypothetical protein